MDIAKMVHPILVQKPPQLHPPCAIAEVYARDCQYGILGIILPAGYFYLNTQRIPNHSKCLN